MNIFHNHQNIGYISTTSQNDQEKKITPYISLWRAVLLQALIDASSNSKKKIFRKRKIEAQIWLSSKKNKQDLEFICALAGLDFKKSQENITKALLNNCQWRNTAKS